ncbi:TfoX/Sxy family protein [bacterium]|nr:TfoX/Sxy family protein [bacterium]
MAYNTEIAERLRDQLLSNATVDEKKMFGGIAFMVNGHMCVGVVEESLVVRVGAEQHDACLALPHTRQMDFTGRPMKNFVYIDGPGFDDEASLVEWIDRGLKFVNSLPPK